NVRNAAEFPVCSFPAKFCPLREGAILRVRWPPFCNRWCLIAPSGHASVHSGQKTHAPRSIVSGFRETACVGHTSTQAEQPSLQRAESSFGLPRNLSGTDAAVMLRITGCPSARRTVTELWACNFICNLFVVRRVQRTGKVLTAISCHMPR